MPFDSLVMRAIEARFRRDLMGKMITRIEAGADRLLFTIRGDKPILMVLAPGIQRIHRTLTGRLPKRPLPAWLDQLLPSQIIDISVPPFERIMRIDIRYPGDLGETVPGALIVELAGHLTNLIRLNQDNTVMDAWRRVAPGRPGRTVWPGFPYTPPPVLQNPLTARSPKDLPPWAKEWLKANGSWETLSRDFEEGFLGDGYILSQGGRTEVWVYPQAGYQADPQDLESAIDAVYWDIEQKRALNAAKAQLLAEIKRRQQHLGEKLAHYSIDQLDTGDTLKEQADLYLTYQSQFSPGVLEIQVDGFDGTPTTLTLDENETPAARASRLYRQYKKTKARQQALARIIPTIQHELQYYQRLLEDAEQSHPLSWYQQQFKQQQKGASPNQDRSPFRHFVSSSGMDIWVGKTREDNARLTFQKARPDDIWFHTKQTPGSHVILGSGKSNPPLADLLDAAQLAVFFSSASASSNVPVDYTRRKFVRKRPHGEPGQVLYQREKTLYVTPDAATLKRLGAMSEKLVDD